MNERINHESQRSVFETRCSLLTQATVGEVACVFLRYCSVCWNDYKNNSYWGDFLEYISGVTAAHFHKWQIAGLKWHIEYNGQREGKKWTVSFVELCRNTLRTTTAIALQLLNVFSFKTKSGIMITGDILALALFNSLTGSVIPLSFVKTLPK